MRRTSFVSLVSGALAIAVGTFGNSPAVAQRDTVRSEYFTARVLKVESDAPGSKWVTVEFNASPLSQAEAVSIRSNNENCARPAFLTDAEGNKFISADCTVVSRVPDGGVLWLEESGKPLVRRFQFIGPATENRGPYDIVIPITYAKTGEEDRSAPATGQVLSFLGIE